MSRQDAERIPNVDLRCGLDPAPSWTVKDSATLALIFAWVVVVPAAIPLAVLLF